MSLSSIRKEHDRKVAEAEAKRKHDERMRELARHPLLKRGCDRNVRDAYFHGVVVAALADGEVSEIDECERKVLFSIANSLNLPGEEAEQAVQTVSACKGLELEPVLEECVKQMPDAAAMNLFACDFARVWLARGKAHADCTDLSDNYFDGYFRRWAQFSLDQKVRMSLFTLLGEPNPGDVDLLFVAHWLGDEKLMYLLLDKQGDVEERIKNARQRERIQAVNKQFSDEVASIGEKYNYDNRAKWSDVIVESMAIRGSVNPEEIYWEILLDRVVSFYRRNDIRQRDFQNVCWRLLVMMIVSGCCCTVEVDTLLRSAAQGSSESFSRHLTETIDIFKEALRRKGLL